MTLLGGIFLIPRDPPSTEVDRTVDWTGAFLATAGLVLLNFCNVHSSLTNSSADLGSSSISVGRRSICRMENGLRDCSAGEYRLST